MSTAKITVTGAVTATPTRTTVAVEATLGAVTARLDVPLVVRGIPGSLDTTRSASGYHNLTFVPEVAALDARGRVWIGGARSYLESCLIERHLATGELDPSFGTNGVLQVSATTGMQVVCGAFVFQGDKLVLAGGELASASGSAVTGLVMRLGEDGTVDRSFGVEGAARFAGGRASGVAIDSAGGIRVGAAPGAEGKPFLVRLDANGADIRRSTAVDLGEIDGQTWGFLPDGTARVASMKSIPEADDAIGMGGFAADGNIDAAFGVTGIEVPTFRGKGAVGFERALAVDAKGRTVVGGATGADPGTKTYAYLMRSPTNTTGGGSWERLYTSAHFPPGVYADASFSRLAIAPDGKILAVGQHSTAATTSELFVARFEEGGDPDLTFAPLGVVVYPDLTSYPRELLLQPDGAILVLAPGMSSSIARIWL